MHAHVVAQNVEQVDLKASVSALEEGSVLFFPDCAYPSLEPGLFSERILDKRHKNVSYDAQRKKLGAYNHALSGLEEKLSEMLGGYAAFAAGLIARVLPEYMPHLHWGRTSFRPAEIEGRVSSKRKDDTRLHVDSFSATPVNGLRILRVFCNVNPHQVPRIWNIGEPFPQVLARFAPAIPSYNKGIAHLLNVVKTTKTLRSAYDHYMLHLHDAMKKDDDYQAGVEKTTFAFPANSTWIVFTDHVSHAALSGQHLLEQTFYLPVDKMDNPECSPLYEWMKFRPELRHAQ